MEKIIVEGGKRLTGEVSVTGAKNAVLPILAATVIGANESTIFNVPNLKDVDVMEKILLSLGCNVKRFDKVMWIDSKPLNKIKIPEELVREIINNTYGSYACENRGSCG
jgi:UDP-N-acetylglucosamine 1-carboxyvinyltransferase